MHVAIGVALLVAAASSGRAPVDDPPSQPQRPRERVADDVVARWRGSGVPPNLDAWRSLLLDHGCLEWRARWPIERPFGVGLHHPSFTGGSVTLVPLRSGWRTAHARAWQPMCSLGTGMFRRKEDFQELGRLSLGPQRIEFRIEVEVPSSQLEPPVGAGPRRVALGTVHIDVEGVARIEDALEPIRDPEIGNWIAANLVLTKSRDLVREPHPLIYLEPSAQLWDLPVSVRCTLERRGESLETVSLYAETSGGGPAERLATLSWKAFHSPRHEGPWALRIRGTPDGALRSWTARRYWAGEVVIPLENLRRE